MIDTSNFSHISKELNAGIDDNMLCDTVVETALRLLKNTQNTQKFRERRILHSGKSFLWIRSVLNQKKIKILDNKRVNRRIYQSRLSIYFPMFILIPVTNISNIQYF